MVDLKCVWKFLKIILGKYPKLIIALTISLKKTNAVNQYICDTCYIHIRKLNVERLKRPAMLIVKFRQLEPRQKFFIDLTFTIEPIKQSYSLIFFHQNKNK